MIICKCGFSATGTTLGALGDHFKATGHDEHSEEHTTLASLRSAAGSVGLICRCGFKTKSGSLESALDEMTLHLDPGHVSAEAPAPAAAARFHIVGNDLSMTSHKIRKIR